MRDEHQTVRELCQSAAIGAVAFPAIIALVAALDPALPGIPALGRAPLGVTVLLGLAAIAHGAAFGFAVGLALLGSRD